MSRKRFKEIEFSPAKQLLIDLANQIIAQYQDQDLRLTLRQLYYQFVTRNALPNTERSYKSLGKLISDARLAGLVDWDAIEDRVRIPRLPREFHNLRQLVRAALYSYRLPRWRDQEEYVELWVEKDALSGVLAPLAEQYHVTLMVNRGYSSQSAMYEAARRFIAHSRTEGDRESLQEAKMQAAYNTLINQNAPITEGTPRRYNKCHLLYLGDHDPSGEDMVRDIQDRLDMFGANVSVHKVALTMNQVEQYGPPPNPAKLTDSRSGGYIAKYGNESWEVDALPPEVLHELIEEAILSHVDLERMDAIKRLEEKDKEALTAATESIMGSGG